MRGWECPVKCRKGRWGWWCLPATAHLHPFPHSFLHSQTPSILPSPSYNAPGGAKCQPCIFTLTMLWSSDERENTRTWTNHCIRTYMALIPPTFANLIASSTVPIKSQIYLCTLSKRPRTHPCFYFDQLCPVSLTISPSHFRVAEISFFALDYKVTTKLISHGKLFDIPRHSNIA